MDRSTLGLIFASALTLVIGTYAQAAQAPAATPTPKPVAAKHLGGLSNRVRVPKANSIRVSAAECNRRAVMGVNSPHGALGPNGASGSQTLVAVPLGGGSTVASATREQQISEACAHLRR